MCERCARDVRVEECEICERDVSETDICERDVCVCVREREMRDVCVRQR